MITVNARALLPALALLVACFHRREIARQDWPALEQTSRISVRTLDSNTHSFTRFVFAADGLSGWKESDTARTDSLRIPLDSIAVVRLTTFDKKGTALLLATAATAAFIVIAEGKSDVRPAAVPRPTSCPFLYSFDGREYVFDSETYAGAIARGLERVDVDNLDALRAVDGTYRLRLTNERPETHYTDELALLVVDHARGTRAIPDAAGAVHLVRGERAATGIVEFGAADTTPARGGWELTLPRPAGDSAALVLRVRNTPMAPFALHQILSLLGSEVYTWYASLRGGLPRASVRGFIDSEGSLDVQLRSGDAWRSVGRVPDVGPAIAKSIVVRLDLRGVQGDTVRVRLESTPQLWVLEEAQIALHAGVVQGSVLRPRRATDELGSDVTSRLAARDADYLVTARGSVVSVEFDAPPPPAADGMTRTVLARTAGHYYVHTDDRGTPRRDIVARLMTERKFLQDYVLAEWARANASK